MKNRILCTVLLVAVATCMFGYVNWGVSDTLNNVVLRPRSSTPEPVTQVTSYTFPSPVTPRHDAQNEEYGARYIGVSANAKCPGGTYTFMRELGVFDSTISQAVIWFSADECVDSIGIKWNGVTHWITDMPENHYAGRSDALEMHRVDFSDVFLTYDYASACTLIIPVRNYRKNRLGLNYFYTIEEGVNIHPYYIFRLRPGFSIFTIPFRIDDPEHTCLSDMFPTALGFYTWDEYTLSWTELSMTDPLIGELGDICKSRSILTELPDSFAICHGGYGIEEQHYMDFRPITLNSYDLHHGNVDCDIPYDFHAPLYEPDDIPNGAVIDFFMEEDLDPWSDWSGIYMISARYFYHCFGYYSTFDTLECAHLALWCGVSNAAAREVAPEEYEAEIEIPVRHIPLEERMMLPPSRAHKSAIIPDESEINAIALPNPFNSTVNIEVSNISSSDNISIDIFDINGKHIRDISNIHTSGNSVEAKWNGKNNAGQTVPAGIYMYKIQSGKETVSGRLLYVK